MAINTDANRDQATYNVIGEHIQDKLHELINEKDVMGKSEGLTKVLQWYDETKQHVNNTQEQFAYVQNPKEVIDLAYSVKKLGKEGFISKFATLLAKRMVEEVKIPFVEMTLDKIRIETKGKQQQVKIKNFETKVGPLRPVVEIVYTAFAVPHTSKVKFQIDATVKIPEMEFYVTPKELGIQSGKLSAKLNLSVLEAGVDSIKIKRPRLLGKKEFDVDLSGHKISMKNSKKCAHCHTPNPASANFCCQCGKSF